jgi:hypothetical protein
MSQDRFPLELAIEISGKYKTPQRMTKTVYAQFVPQHGMEIMDTEIIFRVKTMALAGLQALKHTASPLQKGRWVEGSRKVVTKLFPTNDEEFVQSVEFFTKQGWTVER